MAKLTNAQQRVLEWTAIDGGIRKGEIHGEDWRRIDRLSQMGLCDLRTFDGYRYVITDAGREALAKAEDERHG